MKKSYWQLFSKFGYCRQQLVQSKFAETTRFHEMSEFSGRLFQFEVFQERRWKEVWISPQKLQIYSSYYLSGKKLKHESRTEQMLSFSALKYSWITILWRRKIIRKRCKNKDFKMRTFVAQFDRSFQISFSTN